MKRTREFIAAAAIFCGDLIGGGGDAIAEWTFEPLTLGFTLGFRGEPSARAATAPAGDKK
jgi:hypothetical protein